MEKYFRVDAGPRYYEDSEVNGEKDVSVEEIQQGIMPRMPFVIKENNEYRWQFDIDLETGKIVDWPNGTTADIFYKVCDDGTYAILDENKNILEERNCYVPDILSFAENNFGDYIEFNVKSDGTIENFPTGKYLEELLDRFKVTESF